MAEVEEAAKDVVVLIMREEDEEDEEVRAMLARRAEVDVAIVCNVLVLVDEYALVDAGHCSRTRRCCSEPPRRCL